MKRGETQPVAVPCASTDTIAEELEEFAQAVRGGGAPEVAGDDATTSACRESAPGSCPRGEGRRVDVAEILAEDSAGGAS